MSFTLRLSQDLTAVEAGATVPLSVEIANKGEESDHFEMQVEGLDPEWTALPEPDFTVGSREINPQKIFFKPPRASESLAGNYPFVVRVRSLNTGEARTAQGVLQIKPFHHVSLEVSPKKGFTSPVKPQCPFTLSVMNLGNTEHTLQLAGTDPEEECTYEFESDHLSVGPGHQKQVEVTIRTGSSGWVAPVRLFGFVLSARSVQNPSVMASTQGQLERRPVFSLVSVLTVAAVVAAALLWYAFRPLPPEIRAWADSTVVLRGQPLHYHWRALHAQSVRLEIRRSVEGKVLSPETLEDLPVDGSKDILATNEDTITVTATAVGENKVIEGSPLTASVQEAPKEQPPKISKFKASAAKVKLGEPILFNFDYSDDVAKLVLSPLSDKVILPPAKQIQITPTQIGSVEYQLIAYNSKGGYVKSRPITVEAFQVSEAVILEFVARPQTIQAPDQGTTVSWNVTNAVLVQLDDGSGQLKKVNAADSLPVITDHDVTLKLIATDSHAVTTSKTLLIHVKPAPSPEPPPVFPPTAGGGGE